MNTMNLKPAFEYHFKDLFKSVCTYFLIILLVFAAIIIFSFSDSGDGSAAVGAFGMATGITLFVIGICSPRDHLRLCIQMGVGRLTAFVSEVMSVVAVSLCLAVAGEVMMTIGQAIVAGRENVMISDMYQLIYVGFEVDTLTFGQHLLSLITTALISVSAYAVGAFLSLVFYRLNKTWRVVVAVGVPVFALIIFPTVLARTGLSDEYANLMFGVFRWLTASFGNFVLFFAAIIVLAAIFNWLLTRKAPITKEKG